MKLLTTAVLIAVFALAGPLVAHALVLNTAPLSPDVNTGTARCVVSNTSTKEGAVTVEIFSDTGAGIVGGFSATLAANATTESATVALSTDPMGYCRCTVPNKKFLCSLVWFDGTTPMVIHGQ